MIPLTPVQAAIAARRRYWIAGVPTAADLAALARSHARETGRDEAEVLAEIRVLETEVVG